MDSTGYRTMRGVGWCYDWKGFHQVALPETGVDLWTDLRKGRLVSQDNMIKCRIMPHAVRKDLENLDYKSADLFIQPGDKDHQGLGYGGGIHANLGPWSIHPAELSICQHPDGSDWLLGTGAFGELLKVST
jgi:hypothetical protein